MFFLLMIRRPRRSTPFPCTTLFRSRPGTVRNRLIGDPPRRPSRWSTRSGSRGTGGRRDREGVQRPAGRSEEHTSELQSRQYLVCRLLLEKKKSTHISLTYIVIAHD